MPLDEFLQILSTRLVFEISAKANVRILSWKVAKTNLGAERKLRTRRFGKHRTECKANGLTP